MTLRIAQVLAPAAFGGLERVTAGLATGLARRGHTVHVIALLEPGQRAPAWCEALRDAGIALHVIVSTRRGYLAESRALRAIVASEGIEILHTHGDRADLVHGAVMPPPGCRRISTVHGFARSGRWAGLAERVHTLALERLDAVVAVSRPLRERLLREGISPNRLTEIVNGGVPSAASPLTREEARRILEVPPQATVLGWVGRLSAEKAPDLAVGALAALRRPDVTLVFVGDGPERQATEARAASLGVASQLRFAGSRADAARLFGGFDALLLSSRTEGTPMVVLEAVAADVPVVATPVGGVPDVLGGDGILASAVDPSALAAALQRFLENPAAAVEAVRRLHARLRQTLLSEGWIDEYVGLYQRVLAEGVPPR